MNVIHDHESSRDFVYRAYERLQVLNRYLLARHIILRYNYYNIVFACKIVNLCRFLNMIPHMILQGVLMNVQGLKLFIYRMYVRYTTQATHSISGGPRRCKFYKNVSWKILICSRYNSGFVTSQRAQYSSVGIGVVTCCFEIRIFLHEFNSASSRCATYTQQDSHFQYQ